jgi:hypothetical protein
VREHAIALPRHRIFLRGIEKRKRRRHEITKAIRPRETRIEVGAAGGAGDMGDDPSNARSPCSSALKPSYMNSRSRRPSCDGPNA